MSTRSVSDEINQAIAECAAKAKWPPTKVAAVAGATQHGAENWIKNKSKITGDRLIRLLREMPGLRERLLPESIAQS